MKSREVATPRSPSLAAHEVFVRRAREAAHQALFLLLHVRSTRFRAINRVLERGLAFTFVQARALIHGVAVPSGTNAEAEAYFQPRTVAPLGRGGARDATIFGGWGAVQDKMDAGAPPRPEHVVPAIEALRHFLVLSRPKPLTLGMLDHVRMTVVRQLSRRLTTLLAAVAVLLVLLKVEVVHNLIWNDTRKTPAFLLVTIGLSLTLWLIPVLAIFLSGFVGARAFWGLRALPPERGVQRWPPDGGAARFVSFAYTLTAIALLAWFGVFMWLGKIGVLAEGRLTVFTTLSMLWGTVFVAHAMDRWAFIERRSVRLTVFLFAVILGGLVIFSQGASSPHTESILRVVAVGVLLFPVGYEIWRAVKGVGSTVTTVFLTVVYLGMAAGILEGAKVNHDRVWRDADTAPRALLGCGEWPYAGDADWPAVLVAASGGGSRAAYFTARTLEMLNQIEIDDEPTAIAAHIQAISSVSGGSLASAVYIARGYRQALGTSLALPPAPPSFASKPAVNLAAVSRSPRMQSAPARPTAAVARRPPSELAKDLANAVKDDYLWPTIKGFLWPGTTRGDSIEAAWEDVPAALRGIDLADLATAWRGHHGNAPPFPMPLFNSCTLDAQDVVISPLPHGMYSDSSTLAVRALRAYYGLTCSTPGCTPPGLTWVADRDGIYGLEQLLPAYTPSLAKAVRASANFPYGFPLVHLEVPARNLVLSPRFRPDDPSAVSVKLTDGGALSNSGMWSLYQLMTLRTSTAAELKRRGVLLVIVNASSMPEYDQERSDLLALGSAIRNNNPRGQYLHREMLARLERDYGDGIQIVQLDLTPTEAANVLTTWSMDAISLQATETEFSLAEKREKEHLAVKWRALRARLRRAGPAALVAGHAALDCEPRSAPDDPLPNPIEAYKVRPSLN